jgi:hypothetical protein
MKFCGACGVAYCSMACQRAAWPAHKRMCKRLAENRDDLRAKSGGKKTFKQNHLAQIAYYRTLPGLESRAVRLAWKHRREHPVIVLRTDPDDVGGKAPIVAMVPRVVWEAEPIREGEEGPMVGLYCTYVQV